MEELDEKLKLMIELEVYYNFYKNWSFEQIVPYFKSGGEKIKAKEKKACIEFAEEFVDNHQQITFRKFIQEWVKKANKTWENGKDFFHDNLTRIKLEFNIHHYIAKVIMEEIEKEFSEQKYNEIKEMSKYYTNKDDIFQYKVLSPEQNEMYEKITVGISKKEIQKSFKEYIKYISATLYLIHENILEEHIIDIIEKKAKVLFDLKMCKKDIKNMAKEVYDEIIHLDSIKTYIVEQFLKLKEKARYQLNGLEMLFDFTHIIFEQERELVKRGRELTKKLFYGCLIDEFIESNPELKMFYEKRIIDSMETHSIMLYEKDKEWFMRKHFDNIDNIPDNYRKFKVEINLEDNGEKINIKEDEEYNKQVEKLKKYAKQTEEAVKRFENLANKLPDLANDGEYTQIIVPKEEVSTKAKIIIENIEKGLMEVNTIYDDGRTVLINFIDYNEINEYERFLIISKLIEKGADVNLRDASNGQTPLYYAAQENKLNIARLLIEKGAKVDAIQTNTLQTPLHAAAGSGNVELIKLLLKNGADINSKSKTGTIAIMKPIMVYMMHLNGAGDFFSSILTAGNSIEDMKETIKLLIERGSDLDTIADPNYPITIREILKELELL